MNNYAIIPKPVETHAEAGSFEITPETIIMMDDPNQENAAYLRDFLAPPMGFSISLRGDSGPKPNSITLKMDSTIRDFGKEGYCLSVKPDAIVVKATAPPGIFYGIQTLRQLLPIEIEQRDVVTGIDWRIPCCEIVDFPRFPWRGFMLDEGRHFQGKETVFTTLDLMALHKLNIFHWHLTEDQGWRIEIKRYPKLTQAGSQRPGTARSFNEMRKRTHDGLPHGGFYHQDEIREIVAYATQRQISIIPEIEIPGHCRAAIAAYPELSCTADEVEVATGPGIYKDIYCPGKEATFEFLENVLDEILMLFPSRIIHIGGDEAPKARWKECPHCQRRIQSEGLKSEHELQTYFINRIAEYLISRGRQIMGWNEILGVDLVSDALIQYWVRNQKGLITAIKQGRKVINSAYLDTYLDHGYCLTPLSRAYHFEPIFKNVDPEAAKNILGLEAPLWTEWIPNRSRLDYQIYPRLTAFAEVGWTPKSQREYADFRRRLQTFNRRLDLHRVMYAPESDWEPPWYRRIFGIFTIAQPQTRVRDKNM